MRHIFCLALAIAGFNIAVSAQNAEELVAKNTQAKGGIEKIKAIKSLRMVGKLQQESFTAQIGEEARAPSALRQTLTVEGMTAIQAYDGSTGWQISPFQGRKDPELLGEDDLRELVEEADFYGPLIDAREKGNTIEFLGHDTVDGDDAYRLKVTLKNGDIIYYYLDPDTFLEIRTEKQQFIRGSVRETVIDLGSYKQVAGVYFPFSVESGPRQNPAEKAKVIYTKIEANVPLSDAEFKMPASPAVPSPQSHPEPSGQKSQPEKPPTPKPPKQL